MRQFSSIGLLLIVFLPIASPADELTVACWNAENLFDMRKDTDHPGERVPKEAEFKNKMTKLAEVVKYLKADIVGLTEVENQGVLRTLTRDYLADQGYEHFLLIEQMDPRGIDMALISKLPFTAFSFDIPGHTRGILAGRFTIGGEPFYVLVNHWKSRVGGGEELRMACAKRTLEVANDMLPRYEGRKVPALIMGDFNDDDDNESVLTLEKGGLLNTLKSQPAGMRWTYPWWDNDNKKVHYHSFDHVFVNDAMTDQKGIELVPNSARVVRPSFMLRKRKLNNVDHEWVDGSYADHIGYSDHLPVVAKVRTADTEAAGKN